MSCAPPWVDAALVQRALDAEAASADGEAHAQAPAVRSVSAQPLGAAGENFASRLLRVRAQLEGGAQRSLVLKCEAEDAAVRDSIRQSGFFPREIAFLTRVYPTMQGLLEAAAPGRFPPLAARCLLHGAEPHAFLLLEDLGERGFLTADRVRGLGLRHSLLALSALARLHAASAAALAARPPLARELSCPWRTAREDPFDNVLQLCFGLAGEAALLWPDLPDEYARVLARMKAAVYDKFAALCRPKPGRFNVIVHADYWTNNILFRYEHGVPVEVRVVDYQISHVSSPAMDLLRFLYTSLHQDVLERHMDLLVREYHAALQETLELLGIESPTLKDVWADINAHGFYGLFGAVLSVPFMRAEKGNAPDLDSAFKGEGGISKETYHTCSRFLTYVLKDFRRRGWLCWEEFCDP
ncbi:hypothetical protein R5R35_011950 [Gryllus longicercus]|uniref:CHK kinase-like domain-containing protein n=1 Tax=Gryllus longicercus TaxID=2509291 RepID=A0AAN9VF81_9ORTH